MTVADLDGDGRQDLIVSAPARRGALFVLRGAVRGFDRSNVRTVDMADLGLAGRLMPVFGRGDGSCCVTEGAGY